MGLDCMAYSTSLYEKYKNIKYITQENHEKLGFNYDDFKQFWYGRKIRWLYHFFEEIYKDMVEDDDFNCVHLKVTEEDLAAIEAEIKDGVFAQAHETSGFFFGEFDYDEDIEDEILEFTAQARKEIIKGNLVYFQAWW